MTPRTYPLPSNSPFHSGASPPTLEPHLPLWSLTSNSEASPPTIHRPPCLPQLPNPWRFLGLSCETSMTRVSPKPSAALPSLHSPFTHTSARMYSKLHSNKPTHSTPPSSQNAENRKNSFRLACWWGKVQILLLRPYRKKKSMQTEGLEVSGGFVMALLETNH
ncbi:hypothetical protein K432DRAFT_41267 [Lepidopterella palustris CBS 459.81]|uniref:Uncharacterized protein n=1 Tax=Lepidopterella palustris CBS 459.81 TaxID=1314670 RepID=A0A8E2EAP6_9PEZI|nr:hypothetical protein K432DRAFT_41267 [Lepidopterella palustris CBS 459.81]